MGLNREKTFYNTPTRGKLHRVVNIINSRGGGGCRYTPLSTGLIY